MPVVQVHGCLMGAEPPGEPVRQAGEPPGAHPDGQVLALDERRGYVGGVRLADDAPLAGARAPRRAVPGFARPLRGVVLDELAEIDVATERPLYADILLRAFAQVAAVALVYEATGHLADKHRKELQELLKEFLSDRLRDYVPTFPDRYFRELCRVRGVQYRPDMKLPQYFGHPTRDIVYRRLAPNVLSSLERMVGPRDHRGRLPAKLHQGLSEDFGLTQLKQHHGLLIGLFALTDDGDWAGFKALLDRAAPVHKDMPLFDGLPSGGKPSP